MGLAVGDTPAVLDLGRGRTPSPECPREFFRLRGEEESGVCGRGHSCGSDLGGGAETSPECPRGASRLWEEGGVRGWG